MSTAASDTAARPRDAAREVASALVRAMLSVGDVYARESRKLGLTAQQAQLLCTAARRRAGVGELARVLHCGPSNVSRLLDRVASRGLAERGAHRRDGRVALVTLSPAGQELVRSFESDLEARLTRLVADWPEEKRAAAADAFLELVDALDADLAAEESDDEDDEDEDAGRSAR